MARLFWMAVGAAGAVAAARKARKKLGPYAEAAAPISAAVGGARSAFGDFRRAMAEQEERLLAMFVSPDSGAEAPHRNPRRPVPGSWIHDEDDDEPYSF